MGQDVKSQLLADTNSDYLRKTIDFLENNTFTIQKDLDKGVSPKDYDRLLALKNAIQASIGVLRKLWTKFHEE